MRFVSERSDGNKETEIRELEGGGKSMGKRVYGLTVAWRGGN